MICYDCKRNLDGPIMPDELRAAGDWWDGRTAAGRKAEFPGTVAQREGYLFDCPFGKGTFDYSWRALELCEQLVIARALRTSDLCAICAGANERGFVPRY